MTTVTPSLSFPRHGDKINSDFFNEYLIRLMEDRDSLGLSEMIFEIEAMMITVEPGRAVEYIAEICLMSPYIYVESLESQSHFTHILRVDLNYPDLIIREVKRNDIRGIFRSLNEVYPVGANKPNSRYMGEILRVENVKDVVHLQTERGFHFFSSTEAEHLEFPSNVAVIKPSPYTHNVLAYMEREENQPRNYQLGTARTDPRIQSICEESKALQKKAGIDGLILPIDHLATRIYSQNREVAVLEWLSMSSYYFWGAYDIMDQNSSTHVTKNMHVTDELRSPAKVFTGNNTPYFVNHLKIVPSPTETFVLNYGPRLHHLALAVKDGRQGTMENIEFVVSEIRKLGKDFLLDVIGSKDKGMKQIFSSASEHSSLIIEYVQRFGDFKGFFTEDNIAELTHAAGIEVELARKRIDSERVN